MILKSGWSTDMDLIEQAIAALDGTEPDSRNTVNSYLPYRNKGNQFNYDYVAGHTFGCLIGKSLSSGFKLEDFKKECLKKVTCRLDDERFIEHLHKMYFTEDYVLSRVAPEFLLLTQQKREKGASAHLSSVFASFLAAYPVSTDLQGNPNFIEEMFLTILGKYITPIPDKKKASNQAPYLPFMAQNFTRDLAFLCRKTDLLMQNFTQFLKLYNFLYCSQLALNVSSWPEGHEPKNKKLCFILDTERASQDRTDIQTYGYKPLTRATAHVFPILSMLEYLNKDSHCSQPLWKFAAAIKQADNSTDIRLRDTIEVFAREFFKVRKLTKTYEYSDDSIGSLRRLFRYAEDQFQSEKSDRKSVLSKYVKEFEVEIAADFVQNRGRTGRVLVLNQDYLLLLTNLIIGDQRKIHFQKLLDGFRDRGVYFDKQSRNSLINFYDRVGNVDRLSDSGDAIYVRSTI